MDLSNFSVIADIFTIADIYHLVLLPGKNELTKFTLKSVLNSDTYYNTLNGDENNSM